LPTAGRAKSGPKYQPMISANQAFTGVFALYGRQTR
jgi:hypothetical protein